jgi:hypothetical protein
MELKIASKIRNRNQKQEKLTWSPSWRHIGEHRTGNLREQNLPYYSILQNHSKTLFREFWSDKEKNRASIPHQTQACLLGVRGS